MDFFLDAVEARVLGSLIEKEITTPEYYPLSVNALVNACNQKSSRDPVMQLDEVTVRQALSRLEDLNLAGRVHDSRVIKFEHHARQVLDLRRPEIAVLCLLLLRGPQTAGELRNRADRLYSFEDIASVQASLDRMSRSDAAAETGGGIRAPLTAMLPRRPGEKESRYSHLLSGDQPGAAANSEQAPAAELHTSPDRIERLETEVIELRAMLASISARLANLEAAAPQHGS
jgi:hypothetical protein